jgi:hypothetical protein
MYSLRSIGPNEFAIFFIVLWIFVNLLISRLTGWARMAGHYPDMGGFSGKKWRFQTITTRRGMGYKGSVNVGADARGLYLSVFFLFRFGHPPIFVPWRDITITEEKIFKIQLLELRFKKTENLSVRIVAKLGDRIAEAAGSNWPGVESVRRA